ncbi:MAG: hypothetical protein RL033_1202 [Pseudomonadota bacterium]
MRRLSPRLGLLRPLAQPAERRLLPIGNVAAALGRLRQGRGLPPLADAHGGRPPTATPARLPVGPVGEGRFGPGEGQHLWEPRRLTALLNDR